MWFKKNSEELLKEFSVNPQSGLSSEEAKERLSKYGRK
jgi:magnesium-transporting ATPase (P-type)